MRFDVAADVRVDSRGKVKVWLGDNLDHYYILSRFLISRMLTVTKIPHMQAVRIALEVKKYLVDNGFLDVVQEELEQLLFHVMTNHGFGGAFISRYLLVNSFFQQRRPLIILICGPPCSGKSTLAQQVAARMNLHNVLPTDMVYELLRTGAEGQLVDARPVWMREDLSLRGLIETFSQECRVVRRGINGDLMKALCDGKPVIIEGLHLDPGMLLKEFGCGELGSEAVPQQEATAEGNNGSDDSATASAAPTSEEWKQHGLPDAGADENLPQDDAAQPSASGAQPAVSDEGTGAGSCAEAGAQLERQRRRSCEEAGGAGEEPGGGLGEEAEGSEGGGAAAPLILPVVVSMNELDHRMLMRAWLRRQAPPCHQPQEAGSCGEAAPNQPPGRLPGRCRLDDVFHRVRALHDYLVTYRTLGVPVLDLQLCCFETAVEQMHTYILDRIQACHSLVPENVPPPAGA